MQVGRITFGPQATPAERVQFDRIMRQASSAIVFKPADPLDAPHACNCIGPQPGETQCPCRLRAESRQGSRMVREGVVIDGVEYDLVPKRKKSD